MAKVQISIDDSLLARLDEYADRNFTTRSGAISLACNQLIMTDDVRRSIRTISIAMKRISESNVIDDQSKEDLKAFELLAQMMSGTAEPFPDL